MKESFLFNINETHGNEGEYVNDVLNNPNSFEEKVYNGKCKDWFSRNYHGEFFLTPSCTKALEFAASLIELRPGDEIILSTYTHVATVNAFANKDLKLIFIDVNPDNMVIDTGLVLNAISDKTKAVVITNYGGFSCELDKIKSVTSDRRICLIEDNAHGILSYYKDNLLGTYGDLSCFSFERQKNITCGEGGGLLINNDAFMEKARLVYNGGTDSEAFYLGEVSEYSWKAAGTKYGLSELAAAYLWGQLERSHEIISQRKRLWEKYFELLQPLQDNNKLKLPQALKDNDHNAHIFFLLLNSELERSRLIDYLKDENVEALFHYVPLHISDYGKETGSFIGPNDHSGSLYRRLVRLPINSSLDLDHIQYISSLILRYFTI